MLLLAQVMGMYFLSSVLLMRMNLPIGYRCETSCQALCESQLTTLRPSCRQIITEVLGDVPFDFYHTWFDALFLMSVVTTCALLGLHAFSVRAV